LLNLLDDIVNQYESFHQQFELNNQSLTWSEWFKKYWWAPPIVVVSVFITYLRHSTWMTAQG
ncbi:MAG TPA: hypothetical protein VLG71_00905, partial [Candidatus Limnocylindria bacterium]|nr:hypothetical protein [Candidatus Limnocylindria bacterium]